MLMNFYFITETSWETSGKTRETVETIKYFKNGKLIKEEIIKWSEKYWLRCVAPSSIQRRVCRPQKGEQSYDHIMFWQ